MNLSDIKKIADTYGYDPQSRMLIEEMAELTKALNKFWRKNLLCGQIKITPELLERLKRTHEYANVIEEIADVEIMIAQIKYLLNCENEVSEVAQHKISRQLERMKAGDYNV